MWRAITMKRILAEALPACPVDEGARPISGAAWADRALWAASWAAFLAGSVAAVVAVAVLATTGARAALLALWLALAASLGGFVLSAALAFAYDRRRDGRGSA